MAVVVVDLVLDDCWSLLFLEEEDFSATADFFSPSFSLVTGLLSLFFSVLFLSADDEDDFVVAVVVF